MWHKVSSSLKKVIYSHFQQSNVSAWYQLRVLAAKLINLTKPLVFSDEDIARYNLDSQRIPSVHASLLCDEAENVGLNSKPIAVACGRRRAD